MTKRKMSGRWLGLILAMGITASVRATSGQAESLPAGCPAVHSCPPAGGYAGYLFAYFTGEREAVHFAVSRDGTHFRALNGNQPVLAPGQMSQSGGVRDPHLLRAEDGQTFLMVATDMVAANGWDSNRGMVLMKSHDLVHWTSSVVNIQQKYSGQEDLKRVWAPQTIYDRAAGKYMIYWSMKHGDGPDIIYYAYANADFTDLEGEPCVLFLPRDGRACIDGDIVEKNGLYHLFYKTEGHGDGIRRAITDSLGSGRWVEQPGYKQQTPKAVEGSSVFRLNDEERYILMYDVYLDGQYQFCESRDLDTFRAIDTEVTMDFHPRHGSVIPITEEEMERVQEQKWATIFDFDDGRQTWRVLRGNAVTSEASARRGKALKLSPHTMVAFHLDLIPASQYRVTAWMRTESGADDMTMQVGGLGRHNVSVGNARAAWTRMECVFHVASHQKEGRLEFIFDRSQGNTFAWVDEISIERIGDYEEETLQDIPEAPRREVVTDLGVQMQPDETVAWMLDDKLGMFVHWGLYAGPAKGEWYMENYGVSPEEYRRLAYSSSGDRYFDATDFNPQGWVDLAKKMGARYMCLTAQHHDGYALFESRYPDAFTSSQTHGRDFVKEYVEACRRGGLKVGLYKTLINWRFPGYYDVTGTDCKPNRFGYVADPQHKENARQMKEELYCQTRELMTRYGKIDLLFWDGGWLGQQGSDADGAYFWESGRYMSGDNPWPVDSAYQEVEAGSGKALGLMGMVRKHQPDIVVNARCGWMGDFTNEEGSGTVKGEIRKGVVEKCFTLTSGWGYTKLMEDSTQIMPLREIKRIFADCMVRNMCCSINVGPDRHGTVPKPVERRLSDFGRWVGQAAEAIYGTRGGPWQPVDDEYGFCYKGDTIYLYLMGGYHSDTFTMPPVDSDMRVMKAYDVLTKEEICVNQQGRSITLKGIKPLPADITIIAIVLNRNVRQ